MHADSHPEALICLDRPEDRIAVLDGQQRLTALNIGLRGSYAAKTKWRRIGRPQSYPKKHLYLDIAAAPQLAEDRYEDPPRVPARRQTGQ